MIRGDEGAAKHTVDWDGQQVTVIDIHNLRGAAQLFVVGAILKRAMDDKERKGTSKPLMFVVLDELNKYAPRTGWSPIRDVILDIAERGRSLGVSLFGAQQTQVRWKGAWWPTRRCAWSAGWMRRKRSATSTAFSTSVARVRATVLQPGSMIVAQPEIPTPILLRFPFPAWATRGSEAQGEVIAEKDLFARMEDE